MLRLIKRLFVPAALAISVMIFAGWWYVDRTVNSPLLADADGVVLKVEAGSNLTRMAQELVDRGLIARPEPLLIYARLQHKTEIKVGEYRLSAEETQASLLQKLVTGEVIGYQVTFPEGLTLKQWLAVAAEHPKLAASTEALSLDELKKQLGLKHLEGWFFPDTYLFTSSDGIEEILLQAHQRMKNTLEELWPEREDKLPYQTPYDALIMASIVERETGLASERGQIAGVFVRRLKKGMRLQTDPTVIYGLGDRYQGNLKRRHLLEKTPYNTYQIDGLPPTPIAMPGRGAIEAALHPAGGDALFFVARGDGSHYFSATLAEHQKAVRKYQLKRRSDYRSSPVSK